MFEITQSKVEQSPTLGCVASRFLFFISKFSEKITQVFNSTKSEVRNL